MSKKPQLSPKPQPRPQVEVTASGPLPLPEGWEETTLVLSGRHYIFFYNPDNRRVHAPGYPHLPLHSIRLHDGKVISQECLLSDSLLRKYVFFNVLPKYPSDFHRNSISNHL